MAATPTPSFTIDGVTATSFGASSSNLLLPGTPGSDACVRIANLGPCHVAIKLGTANTVTVTPSTGVVVLAGHDAFLTIGSNTYIAGVSCGGTGTTTIVNISTGT